MMSGVLINTENWACFCKLYVACVTLLFQVYLRERRIVLGLKRNALSVLTF